MSVNIARETKPMTQAERRKLEGEFAQQQQEIQIVMAPLRDRDQRQIVRQDQIRATKPRFDKRESGIG